MISGGGTGGHIYPALAIFDQLKKEDERGKFLYVGTPNGLEKELATRAGYDYETVRVMGMPRNASLKSLKSASVLLQGLADANRILKKFKPDIVIGTGGYVSFPVLFMAQRKGIKTLVQEQNAFPGKANRILSKKADGVAIAFKEAKDRIDSHKWFLSGNPIRPEFLNVDRLESRKELGIKENEKMILSFGGSGGQESINDALIEIFKNQPNFKYKLYHITGRSHYNSFINRIKDENILLNDNIKLLDYSHEIPKILSAADLSILSSSAMSLAEVSVLGIPSILIPKEYTADNHQEYNARAFEKAGASYVFLEKELNGNDLYNSIVKILEDERIMLKMKECAKILSRPNSTEIIVENIFKLIKWLCLGKLVEEEKKREK